MEVLQAINPPIQDQVGVLQDLTTPPAAVPTSEASATATEVAAAETAFDVKVLSKWKVYLIVIVWFTKKP